MSVLLIIAGYVTFRFGAGLFAAGEARGGQDLGAGILTLMLLLTGLGLVIWGVIRLFL